MTSVAIKLNNEKWEDGSFQIDIIIFNFHLSNINTFFFENKRRKQLNWGKQHSSLESTLGVF